jgi:alanine-glyoxylate transaminase/serine-glyoxylate transaminase/serine-pyruvate transaminase
LEARKSAKLKRVYYDVEDMLATNPSGNVPYTPSIPLLYGLRESLALLKAEGMDNVIARHHRCSPDADTPIPGTKRQDLLPLG